MKKLIIANWKMQLSYQESLNLAKAFKKNIKAAASDVVICPDYLSLVAIASVLKGGRLALGAQNSASQNSGALTGEVSPANLKKLGVRYVIIGHSERREALGEDDKLIKAKLQAALDNGLIPVLCIGEKLSEKEQGGAKKYLSGQLQRALRGLKMPRGGELIVAYEPLWAIGTGQAIIPLESNLINYFIKTQTAKLLGRSVRVLYGGSVSAANSPLFLKEKNVDGLLVGGASLKIQDFKAICS